MQFYHPKYWGIWAFVGLAKLIVLLPYRTQLALGRWVGRLGYRFAKRRVHIARVNINLCFPNHTSEEKEVLVKQSFESIGVGGIETMIAWFMSEKAFAKIPFDYQGHKHLLSQLDQGKGAILCGGHFTCLELIGRKFGQEAGFHLVYQKHKNPLMEKIISESRARYVTSNIKRQDMRKMVKVLRAGELLWFAPDQDLGRQHSIFVNFFDIPTATVTAISGLAKLGKAKAFPVFFARLPNGEGYKGYVKSAFKLTSDEVDAQAYNDSLEAEIKQFPDQYLWQHRRFKTRPEGQKGFY